MSARDLILSFTAPVFLVWLLVIFVRRKLYSEFPSFFAYIVYALAATMRIFLEDNPLWHFAAYWITEALYAIFALLVLREVFHRVFGLAYSSYWWFRFLLPTMITIVLSMSFVETLVHSLGRPYVARLLSAIYWFDLGVHALEGIILLLVLVLTAKFPVAWRQYEFGVLAGFGFSASVTMIADLLVLAQGQTYEAFFRYGPPLAYLFATLIWLHAFLSPLQSTRPSQMDAQEMQEVIRRSRELLEQIKKALGLQQAVTTIPV
jgi:hypothetical protein